MLTSSDDWIATGVRHADDATTVVWSSGHESIYPTGFIDLMEATANR